VLPGADPDEQRQGLKDKDVFARVGAVEFPSIESGKREIRLHTGDKVAVSVVRDGALVPIDPPPTVKSKGIIGFLATDTADDDTIVALPPARIIDSRHLGEGAAPAATRLITRPGPDPRVGSTPVKNFTEIRTALRAATRSALDSSATSAAVVMTLAPPFADANTRPEMVEWTLNRDDLISLFSSGWTSKLAGAHLNPKSSRFRPPARSMPSAWGSTRPTG